HRDRIHCPKLVWGCCSEAGETCSWREAGNFGKPPFRPDADCCRASFSQKPDVILSRAVLKIALIDHQTVHNLIPPSNPSMLLTIFTLGGSFSSRRRALPPPMYRRS